MKQPVVSLNGKLVPLSKAVVPVTDRAFLFGDAVYEALRLFAGRPWLIDDHMHRLKRSLGELRIRKVDLRGLRTRIDQVIRASRIQEGVLYIQITRGAVWPRSHEFPKTASPCEVIWVQPYDDTKTAKIRRTGARVVTHPDLRWARCDIKTVNLLGNVLAQQAAVEAHCLTAILHGPDGTLTEGTHTSLFGVCEGFVRTAPVSGHILPGITRQFTLKLAAQEQVPVKEEALKLDELPRCSEVFLTGTASEVIPVVQIDGRPVADGRPGPISRRLEAAYRRAVETWLAAR